MKLSLSQTIPVFISTLALVELEGQTLLALPNFRLLPKKKKKKKKKFFFFKKKSKGKKQNY